MRRYASIRSTASRSAHSSSATSRSRTCPVGAARTDARQEVHAEIYLATLTLLVKFALKIAIALDGHQGHYPINSGC
jgi:hypothetical protein